MTSASRGRCVSVQAGLDNIFIVMGRDRRLRAFYQRLVAAGKPKLVALTACMRQLLVFCNALCKQQALWDPTMA